MFIFSPSNKFKLQFTDIEKEKQFRTVYFNKSLPILRLALIILLILYIGFNIFDHSFAPEFVKQFTIIRFGIIFPAIVAYYLLSYTKYFVKIWQGALCLLFILGGIGIVYMLVKIPNNLHYYSGLYLTLLAAFFFLRIRSFNATLSSLILIGIFNIYFLLFVDDLPTHTSNLLLADAFYIASIVIGAISSYHIEKMERNEFLQKEILMAQQHKISQIKDNLEQTVHERTQEIYKAKEKIEQSKIRFKNYIQHSPTAILIATSNGKFTFANSAACKLFGFPQEKLLRMSIYDLTNDRNLIDYYKNSFASNSHINEIVNEEKTLKNKDGSLTHVILSAKKLTNNELIAYIIPINQRKKAEFELKESRKQLQNLFLVAPTGIGQLKNRTIIDVNLRICVMTGYSYEELINQSSRLLYQNNTEYERVGLVKYEQIKKYGTGTIETKWKKKDGSTIDILLSSTLNDTNNPDSGTIFTALDISETKQYQKELILAKEKAEESERLKSAFLANMSHEIRTPMNGILGFLDLLKEPNIPEEERLNFLDIMALSGDRLLNTINDIIDISKIDSCQIEIHKQPINLKETIHNLINFFEPEASGKNIALSYNYDITDIESIHTDINKLDSILTNLLKNAIKYTQHGHISITCTREEQFIQFAVNDSGMGIPKDRQKAIFNRFEQADIYDKKVFQGSGLGLAISKSYTEMLGGSIWVKSQVDIGSTFYFTIPIA